MAKVHIKYTLKTDEENIQKCAFGLKNKDTIIFKIDENTFHLSKDIFFKENKESILKIDIKNKEYIYYLKEYQKNLPLDINIKKHLFTENEYYIEYVLNECLIEFSLIYEVI